MWDWIKKKNNSIINTISTPSRDIKEINRDVFSQAIEDLLNLSLPISAKPSLLYARAAGYPFDVINYEDPEIFEQFLSCLEKPFVEFSSEDISRAAQWFEEDIDFALGSEFWEDFIFPNGHASYSNQEKESIDKIKAALENHSFKNICRHAGYDFGRKAIEKSAQLKEEDLSEIFRLIIEKSHTLLPIFQRSLAADKNKYGEQEFGLLFSEIREFLDYFFPEGALKFYFSVKPFHEVSGFIIDQLSSHSLFQDIPANGVDFEYWCAQHLERQGWNAIVTKSTGDQGVDIEVLRDGFRVVVQCKRYSKPIGNKAVQEVFTGRQHRSANAAAIIGTGGFTRSAIELASSTGVELFNAEDIHLFSNKFGYSSNYRENVIEDDELHLSLGQRAELILGKTFLIVAEKHLPFIESSSEDIGMLSLSRKIMKSIDESSGSGCFSLSPDELVYMLTLSEITLTSMVELAEPDVDYTNVRREGSSTVYNKKVTLEDDVAKKVKRNNGPVPFYSLFDENEVRELKELMLELYKKLPINHAKALDIANPNRPFTNPQC